MTVDEFALVQRHYPIVFSIGDSPVPMALMGLNEGVNVFLDEDGRPLDPSDLHPGLHAPLSVPAGAAPARTATNCRCASTRPPDAVGEFEDGEPLFDGDQPSEATKAILEFCEQFEAAGQRTAAFIEELKKSDLLMDGEVAIQPEGCEQPFIYRGFRMVDEDKLRELRGDELRKMNQNGMLPLIYAHLFSLSQMRDVFGAAGAAGQGAGSRCRSRRRRPPKLFGGGRELAAEQRFAKLDGERLDQRRRLRSNPGPARSKRRDRDSSGGRSRSAARGRRAPGARGAR